MGGRIHFRCCRQRRGTDWRPRGIGPQARSRREGQRHHPAGPAAACWIVWIVLCLFAMPVVYTLGDAAEQIAQRHNFEFQPALWGKLPVCAGLQPGKALDAEFGGARPLAGTRGSHPGLDGLERCTLLVPCIDIRFKSRAQVEPRVHISFIASTQPAKLRLKPFLIVIAKIHASFRLKPKERERFVSPPFIFRTSRPPLRNHHHRSRPERSLLTDPGSSTVTWQLYSPGFSLPNGKLIFTGSMRDFGSSPSVTLIGGVSITLADPL